LAHIQKRSEQRYRVRYRDPGGSERSRSFPRLADTRRFKATVEEELARGLWVDPRAGRTLFQDLASTLTERKVNVRPATRDRIGGFLRAQILPRFGSVPLYRITRHSVQAWVDCLAATLAARTVRDSYRILAGLLRESCASGTHPTVPLLPHLAPPFDAGRSLAI